MSKIPKPLAMVYISGPITGFEEGNFSAFKQMEDRLKELECGIINPHRLFTTDEVQNFQWEDFMKRCIKHMMDADLVVTLDEWHNSKGATMEVHIAHSLGIKVTHHSRLEFNLDEIKNQNRLLDEAKKQIA